MALVTWSIDIDEDTCRRSESSTEQDVAYWLAYEADRLTPSGV